MSLTLVIETSNPASAPPGSSGQSVAIGMIRRGSAELLDEEAVAPPSRTEDDLMPAIDRLVRRVAVRPRDIAVVGVSIGPGGFTGLRVAVATAKMLALASRAGPEGGRCIAIPSALVAAWEHEPAAPLAVALAGKHETAHITVFGSSFRSSPMADGAVMDAAGVAALAGRGVALLLADRHLPAMVRSAAESAGMRVEPPVFAARTALAAAARIAPVEPGALLPLYPREPEAVTLWRQRKSKGA
ncbi:MAG: hypothetical protein ACT4PL_09975 [Phycisphaerales bacterium]